MRTVASENESQGARGQGRLGSRSRSAAIRKTRLRSSMIESLEDRTLLAVLPPITVTRRLRPISPRGA